MRQYAVLFERCVQSSTRVRKAQAVTRQTKHIRNLLPQCASDATGFLSDVYKKSTRARKFLADGVQCGRSMIEMLGVLAIIAVLSVGGIAGYSKAMEMWKINKTVEGYSYLTQGLMEHIDKLRILQPNNDGTKYYLGDTIKELNLVPEGWSLQSGRLFTTSGSVATVFSRNNRLVYDVELGNYHYDDNIIISDSFSTKLCQELMNKFAKPLHSSLQYAWIFKTQSTVEYYYGDSLCSNRNNCIINMTLSDIQNACNSCITNNEFCLLVFEF